MNKGIVKTSRNIYLDYLRGISALMVMLFHYTARYDMLYGHVGNYPLILSRGSFAVLMFFLLSGYLTFKGLPKYSPKSFIKNRFFRLYPTYWLCLITTWVLVMVFMPSLAVSGKDFFLNFTMLQMYLGADFVDGAYWTLACEVLFYVLVLVVCLFKGGKYGAQVIIGWFILQLLLLLIPNSGVSGLVKKFNFYLYFHCFMAGGVVAILEKQWVAKNSLDKIPISMIVVLCVALVFFVSQQFIDHEFDSGLFMAISVLLLGVFVLSYNKWGGVSSWLQKLLSPIAWVASISYPLYLLHQNIGYIIINKMEAAGLTNEIFIIIPITVILLAAWLVHRFIEQPCISMGNRKIEK